MEWWRVVLYLLPVALAMAWIRHREGREGVTLFEHLEPAQKAWILLLAIPPGPAGRLVSLLTADESAGYALSGEQIRGTGQNLVPGVLREFVRFLPEEWTRGAGRDPDELVNLVSRRVDTDAEEVVRTLLVHWPPPALQPAPQGPHPGVGEEEEPALGPPEDGAEGSSAPAGLVPEDGRPGDGAPEA